MSTGLPGVPRVPGKDRLLAPECAVCGRWRFRVLVSGSGRPDRLRSRSADGLFQQEAGSDDNYANHGGKRDSADNHECREQDE